MVEHRLCLMVRVSVYQKHVLQQPTAGESMRQIASMMQERRHVRQDVKTGHKENRKPESGYLAGRLRSIAVAQTGHLLIHTVWPQTGQAEIKRTDRFLRVNVHRVTVVRVHA